MEENFQSVMRRLAHIVHGEINKMVPDFAGSILREPRDAIHSRFFPDGVWEEHREYLVTQLERPEQMTKNHAFNGSYRGTDEMVYFGDRRPQHGTWGGGGGGTEGESRRTVLHNALRLAMPFFMPRRIDSIYWPQWILTHSSVIILGLSFRIYSGTDVAMTATSWTSIRRRFAYVLIVGY